jgi:sugar/nucleoside kinase (ribokinase family)
VARVAVIGLTVADVIILPGEEPRESSGGAPLFAARALAGQRARAPVVITRCHAARLAAPILPHAALLCLRLDQTSFRSVLRYRPDGERAHRVAGLGSSWTAEELDGVVDASLGGVSWVHAGTQRAGDLGGDALAVLARDGRRVALDGQGPLRAPALGPLRLTGVLTPELLRHVHALKLSEEEADAAFGTLDAVEIARRTGVAEVLVTLGATGARVAAGDEQGTVSSDAVVGVDPTGAGDSFLALYADGRAEGLSPLLAADAACAGVSAVLADRLAASAESSGRARPVSQS